MTRTLALVAVLLPLMAAGCGGDGDTGDGSDEATLEAYFQQLGELAVTFDEQARELDLELSALAETEGDEAIDLTRQVTSETASVVGDFVGGLRELDAPEEAVEAHEDAVSAGGELAATMDAFAGDAADIETAEEASALRDEFLASFEEFEAFSQACVELQAIADGNGIEVDLRCG